MKWQQLYQQSHEYNFKRKYPEAYADGHYAPPKLPRYKTSGGLTTFVTNYLNWLGHFAERTANMGVPTRKKIPKFNIMSGKLEHLDGGIEWRKGTGTKGTSDIKGHICNPRHQFPIPVYIEIKIRDRQSEDQKDYERKVTASGALYVIVHNPEEFLGFFEYVMGL